MLLSQNESIKDIKKILKTKDKKERKKAIETQTSKKAGEEGKSCLPGH